MTSPGPVWSVLGESIAVWLPWSGRPPALPPGVRPIGNKLLLTASRYESSVAGPYIEFAVMVPARLGVRVGLSAVEVVVDSPRAREGARAVWGAPAEVGKLGWHGTATHRRAVWEDRQLEIVATLRGRARLPFYAPVRVLQSRRGDPVIVNGLARGRSWRAMVDVAVTGGQPDALEAAHRKGRYLQGMRLRTRPARRPVAGLFTLPAPRLPIEPGVPPSPVNARGPARV